jgi:hypothetical protein
MNSRTDDLIRALTRKSGVTSQQMRDDLGFKTVHNSYSLGLLADRKGFSLSSTDTNKDGLTIYRFVSSAKKIPAAAAKIARPAKKSAAPAKAPAKAKAKAKKSAKA